MIDMVLFLFLSYRLKLGYLVPYIYAIALPKKNNAFLIAMKSVVPLPCIFLPLCIVLASAMPSFIVTIMLFD